MRTEQSQPTSSHIEDAPEPVRRNQPSWWPAVLLCGLALLLLGLHLYVYTLPSTPQPIPGPGDPEARWWGIWPVTYLPLWAVAAGAVAVVGAVIGGLFHLRRESTADAPTSSPPAATPTWISLTASGLFAGFYIFAIAHTRWGDAYIITRAMAWPDPALRLTYSWQAPLDVFLHSRVWLAFHQAGGWVDATPAYRLLSPLAGGLYLLTALALTRRRTLAPAWLTFVLLATLGLIQLFFGYVENYSFAAAGILAYLWLSLDVLAGRRPLWLAAGILALTNATHPSTVVLAPSLLYLGWTQLPAHGKGTGTVRAVVLSIGIPMVLVAAGTVALMEVGGHGLTALLTTDRPGGGDARWLVPLFATTTRWEHYTMFSWAHLRDFLNQHLLVAPVVLPTLLAVALLQGMGRTDCKTTGLTTAPAFRFLLTATVGYQLFIWLWNPDYGGQRDWDLFSLAALPLTLLLIWTLPRVLRPEGRLRALVLPLLLLQAWHTAAWIYQNTLPWSWPD